jgi:hypothetical protein
MEGSLMVSKWINCPYYPTLRGLISAPEQGHHVTVVIISEVVQLHCGALLR